MQDMSVFRFVLQVERFESDATVSYDDDDIAKIYESFTAHVHVCIKKKEPASLPIASQLTDISRHDAIKGLHICDDLHHNTMSPSF